MRRICFLLFVTILVFSTNAQNRELDQIVNFVNANFSTQPDTSLELCQKGLELTQDKTQQKNKAKLLARRGVIYDIKGDSEKGVQDLLDAIALQKVIGDSSELSFCYNNLGISNFYRYRYQEALRNYLLSAKIDSARGDIKGWAGTMINVAIIQSNQNKYKQAIHLYDQVLQLVDSIQYTGLYASIYSNRAKIKYRLKDFNAALLDIEKTRPYLNDSKNLSGKMTLEVLSANTLLNLNKYDEAREAAYRGLHFDSTNSYPERRLHLYESLSHVYYALRNIDSAEYYNDQFQELRDSMFTIETQSKVEEIQSRYHLAEKDKAYSELKLIESKQRNIASNRSQFAAEKEAERNLFIAIAAVLVLLGAALFYRVRIKKNEEQVLKAKIDLNEELLARKEAMIAEIHHRVKNNLQLVASMLALQARKVEDDQAKKLFSSSQSRLESMSLIHENLYKKADYEKVDLLTYVTELCDQILVTYAPQLAVESKYEIDNMTLHIDTVVPLGLILNELLTNSIKYAFDQEINPKIEIRVKDENNTLTVRYGDNGKGVKETDPGFGTQLIRSLSRQLKADMSFPKGDGYLIELKIKKYERMV